jgi:phospholipid/cholesterol/gamma-HCH transport system permease protein
MRVLAEPVVSGFAFVGDVSLFGLRSLWNALKPPYEIRETIRQIGEIGYLSLPLIAAAGFAVGAVMSMHTRSTLGRVGAAIGAELGAMRVTEQIDALESVAVDSFKFLAVTRVLACIIALPILTTVMNFTGMLGGFAAERVATDMTLSLYIQRSFAAIEFREIIPATLKTSIFGFIIGTVSSYLGYNASGGSAGVGVASTRSVVYSSIALILANVLLVRTILFMFPDAA